jgi:hypothetical protein
VAFLDWFVLVDSGAPERRERSWRALGRTQSTTLFNTHHHPIRRGNNEMFSRRERNHRAQAHPGVDVVRPLYSAEDAMKKPPESRRPETFLTTGS